MSEALLRKILALDDRLGALGFPPLTPWWKSELTKFYRSGAKVWAAEVGRGGAKSTAIAKVALAETLCGDFVVPPGEVHRFILVSARQEEARNRLILLAAFLDALEVAYERRGDALDLIDQPRGVLVLSATVGAASGHRGLGFGGDECAKWTNSKSSSNPAAEIAASARAMLVTNPNARQLYFSSPLARSGFHFDLVRRGTTEHQYVSRAPTWRANPTVSEAQTHALEPDPRVWSREYAAEPQDAALAAFDSHLIDAAMRPRKELGRPLGRCCVIDPSRGGSDAFAWGICGWNVLPDGSKIFVLDSIRAFEGRRKNLEAVVAAICAAAKRHGCTWIFSDQGGDGLTPSAFRRHGLRYREHGWSAQSKPRAVETLRRLLIDEQLVLPNDRKLREELLGFEETITASNMLTYSARRGAHDDRVAVLISAMFAECKGRITGSPSRHKDPPPYVGGTVEMARGGSTDFDDRLDNLVRRSGGRVDTGSFGSGFGSGGY